MRLKYLNTTAVLLTLIMSTALADDINWKILDGPSITAALTGSTLVYPEEGGAKQEFESDGTTVMHLVFDLSVTAVESMRPKCNPPYSSPASSRTRRATLKHSSDIGTPQ